VTDKALLLTALAMALATTCVASEASAHQTDNASTISAGSVLKDDSLTVRLTKVVRTSDAAESAKNAGKQLLVVVINVESVPEGQQVATVGFFLEAKSGATYTEPSFVTTVELFGKQQQATGSDGATAYLGAQDLRRHCCSPSRRSSIWPPRGCSTSSPRSRQTKLVH